MANVSNQSDSTVTLSLNGGGDVSLAPSTSATVGSGGGAGQLKITHEGSEKFDGYVPLMTQSPLVFDGDDLLLGGVALPSKCKRTVDRNAAVKFFVGAAALCLIVGMVYWYQSSRQRKSERTR